jgi:DNA-3-methyladenine glycosylase
MHKLTRDFYNRDTITVAKALLGKYLVRHIDGIACIGKIVEVEAYLGCHDLASHSAKGRTKRNEVMFGPPGHAYIYLIYGMYYCFNVVTEQTGHASAVLIRALEPIQNLSGRTQGPGLLCKAMQLDKHLNGYDLTSHDCYIAAPAEPIPFTLIKKPRVGVDYAKHWAKRLLRFYIKNNPYISKQ